MIFNDEDLGKPIVNAFYIIKKNSTNKCIEVSSDDIRIRFSFNREEFNPLEIEKNKKINLRDYIYWDVTLFTKETYYLFDLTKDNITLTRLDDNLFNIDVKIENPDMIYCPLGEKEKFNNLYINANFAFEENKKERMVSKENE
jgi:hypothetical protein